MKNRLCLLLPALGFLLLTSCTEEEKRVPETAGTSALTDPTEEKESTNPAAVAGAPDKPAPAPEKPSSEAPDPEPKADPVPPRPKPEVKKIGETTYQLGEIVFDSATREIRIPGEVNISSHDNIDSEGGLLEYAIVHENGKTHESLLRSKVRPFELQVAFLLVRYEAFRGDLFKDFEREGNGDAGPEEANKPADPPRPDQYQIAIHIEWKDADGNEKSAPIHKWFTNAKTKEAMNPKDGVWQFVGLASIPGNPYRPDLETGIAATYLDGFSMLNYSGKENRFDDVWIPTPDLVPPTDTAITIVFRPLGGAPKAGEEK